jgi:hypothetical protein
MTGLRPREKASFHPPDVVLVGGAESEFRLAIGVGVSFNWRKRDVDSVLSPLFFAVGRTALWFFFF